MYLLSGPAPPILCFTCAVIKHTVHLCGELPWSNTAAPPLRAHEHIVRETPHYGLQTYSCHCIHKIIIILYSWNSSLKLTENEQIVLEQKKCALCIYFILYNFLNNIY